MQRRCLLVAAATAFCAVPASWAGTSNLLLNGSFENPIIAPHSFYQTKVMYGWWGSNGIEIDSNGELGAGEDTPFGNQYVELDVKEPSKLVQVVSTTPGVKYRLTFDFADRPTTGTNATSVGFTGNKSVVVSLPDTGKLDFHAYSETFTATAKTSVLSFYPVESKFPGAGNELDNISLTAIPSAAAEEQLAFAPGAVPTIAPFAAGLTGLLVLMAASFSRRWRQLVGR